jgi:hypothetical protein
MEPRGRGRPLIASGPAMTAYNSLDPINKKSYLIVRKTSEQESKTFNPLHVMSGDRFVEKTKHNMFLIVI